MEGDAMRNWLQDLVEALGLACIFGAPWIVYFMDLPR